MIIKLKRTPFYHRTPFLPSKSAPTIAPYLLLGPTAIRIGGAYFSHQELKKRTTRTPAVYGSSYINIVPQLLIGPKVVIQGRYKNPAPVCIEAPVFVRGALPRGIHIILNTIWNYQADPDIIPMDRTLSLSLILCFLPPALIC